MAKGYTHIIRDKETTLHEQPRRVSNLAQGFIIRYGIFNESASSNQRHIIVSSVDKVIRLALDRSENTHTTT